MPAQDEVVFKHAEGHLKAVFRSVRSGVVSDEINGQQGAHPEHGILVDIRVVTDEKLGDEGFVAWSRDHKMNTGGSPGMPDGRLKQVTHRPIIVDLVGDGFDGLEPLGPIVGGGHPAAQIIVYSTPVSADFLGRPWI